MQTASTAATAPRLRRPADTYVASISPEEQAVLVAFRRAREAAEALRPVGGGATILLKIGVDNAGRLGAVAAAVEQGGGWR